jgi:hypothetical protein
MVLLLETADVLQARARRSSDPGQVAILLRRSEQRRKEAARLREQLAARGAALRAEQVPRVRPVASVQEARDAQARLGTSTAAVQVRP